MSAAQAAYDLILRAAGTAASVATHPLHIDQLCLGLTWSYCAVGANLGLAMSPGSATRTLTWPGTVAGRPALEVAQWLTDWNPFAATVGLAAANALINGVDNPLLREATPLVERSLVGESVPANLAVFDYFRPRLTGRKVVVVGRYPGLDAVLQGLEVTVLERVPGEHDLPDPAAEFLLPQADWVFLTASSLVNKTFPRLAELAAEAVTVLMGPSTPWLAEWAEFDIDFLAGVQLVDADRVRQIAAEGGGVRLFGDGVRYAVADIGAGRLEKTRVEIAATYARRAMLRSSMESWYGSGKTTRFPYYDELSDIDARLSKLDTRFKRLWDARNAG